MKLALALALLATSTLFMTSCYDAGPPPPGHGPGGHVHDDGGLIHGSDPDNHAMDALKRRRRMR